MPPRTTYNVVAELARAENRTGRLLRRALHWLQREQDAEDAVQGALVATLLRAPDNIDTACAERLVERCLTYRLHEARRAQAKRRAESSDDLEQLVAQLPDADAVLIAKQEIASVGAAVEALAPPAVRLLELTLGGATSAEIGCALGLSPAAARQRLRRVRVQLRDVPATTTAPYRKEKE